MKSLVYGLIGLGFLGLGFWAYQENYKTQSAQREVRSLTRQIGAAHARLNMLNAEWAYLNRPDRLRELVNINHQRLGLVPMMPEAFATIDVIAPRPENYVPLLDPMVAATDFTTRAGEEPL